MGNSTQEISDSTFTNDAMRTPLNPGDTAEAASGVFEVKNLSESQLSVIEQIGSQLIPPASDVELERVIAGVDSVGTKMLDGVRANLGYDQDSRLEKPRLITATRLAADVGFATLRAEIQGDVNV